MTQGRWGGERGGFLRKAVLKEAVHSNSFHQACRVWAAFLSALDFFSFNPFHKSFRVSAGYWHISTHSAFSHSCHLLEVLAWLLVQATADRV